MKSAKKLLCILMSLLVLGNTVTVSFALNGSQADAENHYVDIQVMPGKSTYKETDTAEITVKVTNRLKETVNNIYVAVSSDNCMLAKGSKSVSDKVDHLNRGDSTEFKLKVVLDSKASGVGFFTKIIMFFKRLFSSPTAFSPLPENAKSYTNQSKKSRNEITFGKVKGNINIDVYYLYGYTDSMAREVGKTDEAIKDIIDDYSDNDGEYSDYIRSRLDGVKEEGTIIDYIYDEETKTYWIESDNGGGNTVIGGIPTDENDNVLKMPSGDREEVKHNSAIKNDVLLLNCLGDTSLYEKLKFMEYDVGQISNFILDDALSLEKIPMIVFLSHGNTYLGKPYICVQKTDESRQVENAALENRQAVKLYGKDVGTKEYKEFIGLLPEFFTANYKNSNYTFEDSTVYLGICNGLGGKNSNTELADAFIDSGCSSVIGFQDEVGQDENINFIYKLLSSAIEEESVAAAFDNNQYSAENFHIRKIDNKSGHAVSFEKTTITVTVYYEGISDPIDKFVFVASEGQVTDAETTIKQKAIDRAEGKYDVAAGSSYFSWESDGDEIINKDHCKCKVYLAN